MPNVLEMTIIEWGLPSDYKNDWVDNGATLFASWTVDGTLADAIQLTANLGGSVTLYTLPLGAEFIGFGLTLGDSYTPFIAKLGAA